MSNKEYALSEEGLETVNRIIRESPEYRKLIEEFLERFKIVWRKIIDENLKRNVNGETHIEYNDHFDKEIKYWEKRLKQ